MLVSVLPDLDVLDYLELFNSTVRVSELLEVSQSTCSRRYRLLSNQLQLDFDRVDGAYGAMRNADLLTLFRCAAQRLRLRRHGLRHSNGLSWLGLQGLPVLGAPLPLHGSNATSLLMALEKRLVDLWFTALLEVGDVVKPPLQQIHPGPLDLCSGLQAIPLFRASLSLVAREDHPLIGRSHLSPADLALFPWTAGLVKAAQDALAHAPGQGLFALDRSPCAEDPQGWALCGRDGRTLACAPTHRLAELQQRHRLVPLRFNLNQHDVAALIAHRDVLCDLAFPEFFRSILLPLRQAPGLNHPSITWLV